MFQAKRLFTWVAVLIWMATDELVEPSALPLLPVLPAVVTEKPEIDWAAAGPAAKTSSAANHQEPLFNV